MEILQWNITSYQAQFEELKKLLEENPNLACLALQETRHGEKTLYPPSNYKILQSTKRRTDDRERGVALLISKDLNYEEVQLNHSVNIEAVAAKIYLGRYYTICSLYISPSQSINSDEIVQLLDQLPKPFLLLGDMNAHHNRWGETTNCQRGVVFEKLLIEEDIALLNEDSKTHYSIQYGTSSLIDLSIASIDCFPDFNCEVLEYLHGSDHYPITVRKNAAPEIGEPSLRFKLEKADWVKFRESSKNYSEPEASANIDEKVDKLTNFILEAAKSAIPVSLGRGVNKIPVPWFNQTCKKVYTERKRAERALKRNHNEANKIAFRRLNAICRRTFKQAKKEAWMRFVSSINVETTLGQIWKKVNKIKGKYSKNPKPLLKKPNGEITDDTKTTSQIFAEAFASVSSEENYPLKFFNRKKTEERKNMEFNEYNQTDQCYNEPLSLREFYNALSSVKETSPGPDMVGYSMIKNAHSSLHLHILSLYNEIFARQIFPTSWRIATVIPIPKPNKDHSSPLNYRPISLTSCLCKLVEKIINLRLVWYLEKGNCLSTTQSGFRKNRSTTDCLAQITCDIQDALISNKHTIIVFFDIMKAYDTSWKRGILRSIYEFGMRGNLPVFLQNFLKNRQIKVKIGQTHSELVDVDEGVPQGSVLSCTLFAIAIDSIVEKLKNLQVKIVLYVDDLTIYATGNTNTAERQIKAAIRKVEEWSLETGFQFSAPKTVAMHVCRERTRGVWCTNPAPQLKLYGTPITCKDSHVYLGLVIDNRLKWNKHIDYLREECQRRLNLLKHLSHTDWGADTTSLLRIYTALIKSKLEYGVEAYGSASATSLKRLDPVQNKAIRTATGAFRTSPKVSLEVLSGIKPLEISRKQKLANYTVRVFANPSNPIRKILESPSTYEEQPPESLTKLQQQSVRKRVRDAMAYYQVDLENIWVEEPADFPPWQLNGIDRCGDVIKNAKSSIPEVTLNMVYRHHIATHDSDNLIAYTDGSKTSDGVAFSMIAKPPSQPVVTKSFRIDDSTSSYSAELHAILYVTLYAKRSNTRDLTIMSDSKSSIQALSSPYAKDPLVTEIQRNIHDADQKVLLCWVPSHIGIPGNEQADKLARGATNAPVKIRNRLCRNDIKAVIRKKTIRSWQDQWTAARNYPGRPNKLGEITDSLSPLPNATCSNRRWERSLARLRLGHCRLTNGFLLSGDAPPECENCLNEVRLTVKHILTECPAHRAARLRAFNSTTVTMKSLLKEGDTSHQGRLYKFLEELRVLNEI